MEEPLNVDHVPVLVHEALDLLLPERGGLIVDCTLGLGGHATRILERAPEAELLGIDRDEEALAVAAQRLERYGSRVRLVQANYADLGEVLREHAPGRLAAGILADLGVSSLQLDRSERGFSFGRDGPLDMRMGGGGLTAADVVNEYAEADLERILREYGEEKRARRIARAIVREREDKPFETTSDLAEVVRRHAARLRAVARTAKASGSTPRRAPSRRYASRSTVSSRASDASSTRPCGCSRPRAGWW